MNYPLEKGRQDDASANLSTAEELIKSNYAFGQIEEELIIANQI